MRDLDRDSIVNLLARVRGSFREPKSERFTGAFITYLFLIGIPLLFSFMLLRYTRPAEHRSSDYWVSVAMVPLSVGLGFILWKFTGYVFVFDGTKVKQLSRTGRPLKELELCYVIRVTLHEDSRAPSMTLQAERKSMRILLTPDLRKEIENQSNQALLPTPASVTDRAGARSAPDTGAADL